MQESAPGCDLLCISPHTDDAEIGLGGTLRLLADRGREVIVCDLTRGELGSNATAEERWAEAEAASAVLELTARLQLSLPDGFISAEAADQVAAVTAVIRLLRPRWIVTAPDPVRHPDHVATPLLVTKACFMARLAAYQPQLPTMTWWPENFPVPAASAKRWFVESRLEVCPDDGQPTLLFDVTTSWAAKQKALACFASQFQRREGRRETWINDSGFLDKVEQRGLSWGRRAHCHYGEALRTAAVPVLVDLPEEKWL